MILFKKADDLSRWIEKQRNAGHSIGFIPTMGALHAGHLGLITAAKSQHVITITSIFVNPTQFNDPADFDKYPITIEKDIDLLERHTDVLFLPSVKEMYPRGLSAGKHYNLGSIETMLEGKFRPGHYQGVCMVVDRLLKIVKPNKLYMGQKDYQQCMVIQQLLTLTGMNDRVKLIVCPTTREKSGLAMSSRNMRLNVNEKKQAAVIFQTLEHIKKNIKPGIVGPLIDSAGNMITEGGMRYDYISIADASTLYPVVEWDGKQKIIALIAAYLNDVRLIDNIIIN